MGNGVPASHRQIWYRSKRLHIPLSGHPLSVGADVLDDLRPLWGPSGVAA